MGSSMKAGNRLSFYGIINGMIRLMAAASIFMLLLHSVFSTSFMSYIWDAEGNLQKHTRNIADSPWQHLAVCLVVTGILWLALRAGRKLRQKAGFMERHGRRGILLLCFLAFVAGVFWIMATQLAPGNDPAKVYEVVKQWRSGDFSSFAEDGYLFRYPFQAGIVLFYYLLSFPFGVENYVALQLVNALALAVIYYGLARLAWEYWGDAAAACLSCLALVLWPPMLFYTTYLYGVLPGMACAVTAVCLMMRYFRTEKLRYGVGAAALFGIAVVLKSNCLIYVVAVCCFLGYDILDGLFVRRREHKRRLLLSCACIVLLLSGCKGFTVCSQKCVERLTGCELSDGAAMISWVVMGLKDSPTGPGEYNGYIIDVFEECHYDQKQIREASVTEIQKVLRRMRENPLDEGVTFFARKMAFQWNDPTFVAIERMQGRDSAITMPEFVVSIIEGKGEVILTVILDEVETLVWVGALLYLLLRRKSRNLYELMGIVIFLGGYLFHFVWESGASYTLPYFVILIPYAVKGFLDAVRGLDQGYEAFRNHTLRVERNKVLSIVLTAGLVILITGLLTTTNLFYRTFALDDGEKAHEIFWNRSAAWETELPGSDGNADEGI